MRTEMGIILRLTKLTETSLIVTWCVDGIGLVKTVAKGARRAKSVYAGKLDLFFCAEFSWVESKRSELGSLREVVVRDYGEGIRRSYKNTVTAGYFTCLVESVMETGVADENVFGLLKRALAYLGGEQLEWRAVVFFEKELAKLLGVWDGRGAPHLCLQKAFGELPKNRLVCKQLILE